tara:strand:- start:7542 stop:8945 length:1404 start_codon:yes stop_codon:yes gene_type:complete
MSSKLKQIDRELLITNKKFEYDSSIEPKNTYFGGGFGDNSEDYVEVLIYDINDNLLETSVADSSDYYYDFEKGGVKLKTGTILRKLGYDRGRFKVTYNFLRKVAGSYETVVTDENDEIFNGDVDINEIDKSLFIKENKYISHEISPSRTEIRLIPQKIKDESYIRNFYKLPARNKKVIAETSDLSNIEFVDEGKGKENSNKLKFSNLENNPQFEESMKTGKIIIPNFFLVNREYPQTQVSEDDVGTTSNENTGTDFLKASFYLDITSGEVKTVKNNNNKNPGDLYFTLATTRFAGIADGDDIPSDKQDDIRFKGDGKTIRDVRDLQDSKFDPVWVSRNDPEPVLDFVSNSSFRADAPTTYTWEVFGWDKDNGDHNQLQLRDVGKESGGNIRIITPDSNSYATVTAESGFKAIQTITGETSSGGERVGSRLRVELFGDELFIGIKLTIKDNTANDSSTIMLPAIIETH